jgi:NADH dehydrogenase/NADH:ubiquinone oxidoreductase subunit G
MYALKLLMQSLGVPNIDARQDGTVLSPAYGRGSYLFNTTIAGIEDADAILIVGSTRASRPRWSTCASASAGAWPRRRSR